jgi:hypothetical protein
MLIRWLAIALLVTASTARADEPIQLQTQYENTVTLAGDDTSRIIVYSDEAGSAQAEAWGEALIDLDCPVVAAANLSAVPGLAREMVAEGFQSRDPVALDWEGRLAEQFGFTPEVANVYLLDARARSVLHLQGAPDGQKRKRLADAARETCGISGD